MCVGGPSWRLYIPRILRRTGVDRKDIVTMSIGHTVRYQSVTEPLVVTSPGELCWISEIVYLRCLVVGSRECSLSEGFLMSTKKDLQTFSCGLHIMQGFQSSG